MIKKHTKQYTEGISYVEQYFGGKLSQEETGWYVEMCRKFIKEFESMEVWSPYIAWKLRAMYELVLAKEMGELKPSGGWLNALYRIVGEVDKEYGKG